MQAVCNGVSHFLIAMQMPFSLDLLYGFGHGSLCFLHQHQEDSLLHHDQNFVYGMRLVIGFKAHVAGVCNYIYICTLHVYMLTYNPLPIHLSQWNREAADHTQKETNRVSQPSCFGISTLLSNPI